MEKPVVVISVRGGVPELVCASEEVQVVVIDVEDDTTYCGEPPVDRGAAQLHLAQSGA